jgi:hypothetical protein
MKIPSYFDKIFVINLGRRQDRWTDCVDEFPACGIPIEAVERIPGYDHPTNGHQGCTRSHRELIRRIAEGHHDRVLVFEDDFCGITLGNLSEHGFKAGNPVWETHCRLMGGYGNASERFSAMTDYIPNDWDVLYLGAGYGEPPIARVNKRVIRCGFMQTTSSYGITRKHAQEWTRLVNEACGESLENHPGPIDNTFGTLSHDFNYYVLQPRLFFQRKSRSDITGETNSYMFNMTDTAHEQMV